VNDPDSIFKDYEDKGFWLHSIFAIAKIKSSYSSFIKVFPLKLTEEMVNDPTNLDKQIIILYHPSGNLEYILTSDSNLIERAKENIDFINEPVGTHLFISCLVIRGSTHDHDYDLTNVVRSLNGLNGWEVSIDDNCESFKIDIKTDFILDEHQIKTIIKKIQYILDFLAITLGVGLQIKYYRVGKILRKAPSVIFGIIEERFPSLDVQTIEKIRGIISLDEDINVIKARRGLNESYRENTLPSKLSRLWSCVEDLCFNEPQDHLLSPDELNKIKEFSGKLETLASDRERLDKFYSIISNPKILNLKGRNEIIAETISSKLGIAYAEAYDKIKEISRRRGEHVHNFQEDWEGLKDAKEFLERVLLRYAQWTPPRTTTGANTKSR
jgi:hypothetical protein